MTFALLIATALSAASPARPATVVVKTAGTATAIVHDDGQRRQGALILEGELSRVDFADQGTRTIPPDDAKGRRIQTLVDRVRAHAREHGLPALAAQLERWDAATPDVDRVRDGLYGHLTAELGNGRIIDFDAQGAVRYQLHEGRMAPALSGPEQRRVLARTLELASAPDAATVLRRSAADIRAALEKFELRKAENN